MQVTWQYCNYCICNKKKTIQFCHKPLSQNLASSHC